MANIGKKGKWVESDEGDKDNKPRYIPLDIFFSILPEGMMAAGYAETHDKDQRTLAVA